MSTTNVSEMTGLLAGAGPARSQPVACEALDLKRILADLADQIADADRRHSTALVAMQERLGALGNTAQGLREQLPHEMTPALDRIEDGMTQLADRLADAEAQRRGSEFARAFHQAAGETAPALKSALAGDALDAFARRADIARGAAGPAFDHFDVVDHAPAVCDPETWDIASAEALTRIYETGDAGPAVPVADTPADLPPVAAAEVATSGAPEVAGHNGLVLDGERDWLAGRFADIAMRLDRSIADLCKDGQLGLIEARFSNLEQKIGAALTTAPTRADLAGLHNIETQVEDLTAQLVTVQTHFSRLDTIELELRNLAERMSTEKLAKIMESHAPKAIDNDLLAGVVASRVAKEMPRFEETLQALADRLSTEKIAALVSQNNANGPDAGAIARMVADLVAKQLPASAASVDHTVRLDELCGMIESFAAEHRHGEEQINTMLDTMQQAMIRLLDRMDAIEQVGYADPGAQPGEPIAYAEAHDHDAAGAAHRHSAADATAQPHQDARVEELRDPGEPQPIAAQQTAYAHANAHGQPVPPGAETYTSGYQHQPAEPPQTVARSPAPEEPAAGSREDFIAAARRAARKAADAPPEPAEEAAQDAPGQNRKLRAKTAQKSGGRSLSRASMAMICLALVGASFAVVKTTILAPSSRPAVEPRAPAGAAEPRKSTEADKRVRNLDDAAPFTEDGRKAPNPGRDTGQPASPRRSSLPGGEVPDNETGQTFPTASLPGLSFPATPGDQAPALPAAYAKDEPLAASAARPTGNNPLPPITIGPNSLRTAAAKGDPSAEYEIGVRFAEAKGVTQDLQQAVAWYQRSAAQGFAPAQYRLGSMYERGLGVKVDLARARIWYQRAAEQGIVKAMHNLAVLSAGRDNAATDYATAAKWFQAAAEHGLTDSQFNLAIMQDSGLGMERDARQAYKWFSLAARAGDEEAARRRESLRAKLSPSEVAEAETELRAWRPRQAEQAMNDPRLAGEGWKQRSR